MPTPSESEQPSAIWTAPIPSPEERGAQAEAFSRAIEREQLRDTIRTLVACAVWSVIGVAGLSWSVATTNQTWAPVVFWGSLAAGYSGILITLASAYRRAGVRSGEW